MIGVLIEHIRAVLWCLEALRRSLATRRRPRPAGLEGLFAVAATDPLLIVSSLNPAEVGRQAIAGAAITDTVAWLEASGFADVDRGDLQRYAWWLLGMRDTYERGGVKTS